MGTCFYGLCHDCKAQIDLDKFYLVSAVSGETPNHAHAMEEAEHSWLRSARAVAFVVRHPGHRIQIVTEYDLDGPEAWGEYREEMFWPWPADRPDKALWDDVDRYGG